MDDVNASHLNANDLIVHFGRCCLSASSVQSLTEVALKEIIYVLPS